MQFISESLISIKLLNDNELKTTIKCNKGYVKSCVNFTVEFKRFCKNSKKIYISCSKGPSNTNTHIQVINKRDFKTCFTHAFTKILYTKVHPSRSQFFLFRLIQLPRQLGNHISRNFYSIQTTSKASHTSIHCNNAFGNIKSVVEIIPKI